MADDAIQPDVSQEEAADLKNAEEQTEITNEGEVPSNDQSEVEEAEPAKLDRDVMMAELAEKRRKQRDGEQPEQSEPPEEEEVVVEAVTPEKADPPDTEEMVELKVNGQIIHRTKQEVEDAGGVAAIQKSIAGDIKLAQAAAKEKLLQQREDEMNERLAQEVSKNRQLEAAIAGQKSNLSDDEITAKSKELADKFFMGDSEDLQGAIADLLRSGNQSTTPAINEEEIANRVRQSIEQENALKEFRKGKVEAQTYFDQEHADLSQNPYRRSYVNDLTKEIIRRKRAAGESLNPMEIMTEAVSETRTRLGIPLIADKEVEKTPLDKKLERKKQSSDRVPTASQRVPAPANNLTKTKKQVWEQIAGKRSHS